MPPKRGELAKKTVIDLLLASGSEPDDNDARTRLATANKNWLLDEAERRGILSPEATHAARDTRNVVFKRYLRTCLGDEPTLKALDAYVRMASDVRSAGSQLLNLFAIRAFDAGWFAGRHVVDASGAIVPAEGRPAMSVVEATLQDQTFLKYGLLPFKSALSNFHVDGCPAALRAVWEAHRAVLQPKYPAMTDLSRMAWDQALTDMAREMAGAVKSHVMVHLGARAMAYLRCRVLCDLGGVIRTVAGRRTCSAGGNTFHLADMYEALESGKGEGLPDVVRAEVAALRDRLGLRGASRLSKLTKLTDGLFCLHMELSRDAERRRQATPDDPRVPRAFSALPVVRTGRTFAYVDDRVMEALVRGFGLAERLRPGERLFESMLGVGKEAWDAASKAARRRRRRARVVAKAASGARRRSRRRRRDPGWARRPDPRTWTATSAATDGVAVCLTLTSPVPPKAPVADAPSDAGGTRERVQEPRHAIAADPGRVIIFEAAQCRPDGSWQSSRLTRKAYLELSCQVRRDEAEATRRRERPELREAIEVQARALRPDVEDNGRPGVPGHGQRPRRSLAGPPEGVRGGRDVRPVAHAALAAQEVDADEEPGGHRLGGGSEGLQGDLRPRQRQVCRDRQGRAGGADDGGRQDAAPHRQVPEAFVRRGGRPGRRGEDDDVLPRLRGGAGGRPRRAGCGAERPEGVPDRELPGDDAAHAGRL